MNGYLMTGRIGMAAIVISGFGLRTSATARDPGDFQLLGPARMIVRLAVHGAARRLSKPTCQEVLSDFTDDSGVPLSTRLVGLGQTPTQYLAGLYFVEGGSLTQCRDDGRTAAFTVPHSHVIYICGQRFVERFSRNTWFPEIVLIHEMLHSLGLGENPPSSAAISRQVWRRCGR